MEKTKSAPTRQIGLSNHELSDYAIRIKKILIAYMVILNLDNLLIYCFEIIFKNVIVISYILISAAMILLIWSKIRSFNYVHVDQLKYLNFYLSYAVIVFVFCNFSIFYVLWYKIRNNDSEYRRAYFKDEIPKYVTIHTICVLIYAALNILFNILILYNLTKLKNLLWKNEFRYTQSAGNQSHDSSSQTNNIQVLDLV